MAISQDDRATQLLTDMIALQTVNPMGRPHGGDLPVERPLVEYLERLFGPHGVKMQRQSVSAMHENLVVEVPSHSEGPATLFESHMDTVPADDWLDRAFEPRVEGTTIYGRGACDDKGSLVSMVLALLELIESGRRPRQPVVLLAAADEEYAQTGIRHFVSSWPDPIGRGVFGEPTRCEPVVQHKGTLRWDITVHGRSAHSSRAELGRNAITDMMRVVEKLTQIERELHAAHTNPLMTGPSLTVTQIQGGRTRSAVPDECTIFVDFRILPGMAPQQTGAAVIEAINGLDIQVTHSDFQAAAPPLSTDASDPFVLAVRDVCTERLGRTVEAVGEPYTSDASWMWPGRPAILLGPGDIATAHAVDECVDVRQVVDCAAIHGRIMLRDWGV